MAAHEIPKLGISVVPQGKRVFPDLEVGENLFISTARPKLNRTAYFELTQRFPQIFDRLSQKAGTLSGGEQQMLAIARSLLSAPKLIMLDEPTEGLMPTLIREVHDEILEMKKSGMAILLAEQHLETALKLCDRIYTIENGLITWEGIANESATDHLRHALGVGLK